MPQIALMGSESFALYTYLAPGCFVNLGIANPEKGSGAGEHNPSFDIDEDAMALGMAAYIAYAFEYLKEHRDIPFNRYTGDIADL